MTKLLNFLTVLLLASPTFASSLKLKDPGFSFDARQVEVLTASEGLDQLGPYDFSSNGNVRYFSVDKVNRVSAFVRTGGCSLGNCIPGAIRYGLGAKFNEDNTPTSIIPTYAFESYINALIPVLEQSFAYAKTNHYAVILKLSSLFDVEIFFVK